MAGTLADSLRALGCDDSVALVTADWAVALGSRPGPYDIAFVDPPFGADLQAVVLERLAAGALVPDARVHVEMPAADAPGFATPSGYEPLREKRFGDVVARLLRFAGG